jgi:hypothetical protein
MSSITQARLLGLAATMTLGTLTPNWDSYTAIVFALGISHYILSYTYAGSRLRNLAGRRRLWLPSATVLLIGLTIAITPVQGGLYAKLLIYFGLHHVINEGYSSGRSVDALNASGLRGWRIALHSGTYLACTCNDWTLLWVDRSLIWLLLAVVALGFSIALARRSVALRLGQLVDESWFDFGSVLLGVATLNGWLYVDYLDVVLYHFLFWALYPFANLARRDEFQPMRLVAMNAALTTAALLFSALGPFGLTVNLLFTSVFYALSYLHITTSFILSSTNPMWLRRFFEPVQVQRA